MVQKTLRLQWDDYLTTLSGRELDSIVLSVNIYALKFFASILVETINNLIYEPRQVCLVLAKDHSTRL
jgi:hypothetical protein